MMQTQTDPVCFRALLAAGQTRTDQTQSRLSDFTAAVKNMGKLVAYSFWQARQTALHPRIILSVVDVPRLA